MNLPNKLTMLRMVMIPFFVIFMAVPFAAGRYIALAIFIAASLTDTADGYIARKYHLITDFGKFMDPLADKLLVCSAMICLVHTNEIPYWVVIIIIAREFIISGFRLVAADNGIVIAMLIVVLLNFNFPFWHVLETVLIYAALILTVASLIDYIVKNKQVLGTDR